MRNHHITCKIGKELNNNSILFDNNLFVTYTLIFIHLFKGRIRYYFEHSIGVFGRGKH